MRKCKTCCYWKQRDNPREGLCSGLPPTPVVLQRHSEPHDHYVKMVFPVTRDYYVCALWENKEVEHADG